MAGFGYEWTRFDQSEIGSEERQKAFDTYFSIFPWELLPANGGVGADIGCGSGRWAMLLVNRVQRLHLVDLSGEALAVARRNLRGATNVEFHLASVDQLAFPERSLDFAYSLGVLHHLPDTAAAIRAIAEKLKPGAPFLVYLYYAFDNRPRWYRALWRLTDLGRQFVSRMPKPLRYLVSQAVAVGVYWPLARSYRLILATGGSLSHWPLRFYADKSLYTMRTDALDRLGTRLEKRFSRQEIMDMLTAAGFSHLRFSENPPFWCAVGVKKSVE